MTRPTNCIQCGKPIEQPKTSKKLYCGECKRKRRIKQVMESRKKRIPSTKIGVGSGNSSKNKAGFENQNTTTGIMLYRLFRKDTCEKCGSTENLCVHHIDGNRKNNVEENMMTLCKKCHQKLHTKRDPRTGRYIKH